MYFYPPPSRLDLLHLESRLRSAAVGWIRRAVARPGDEQPGYRPAAGRPGRPAAGAGRQTGKEGSVTRHQERQAAWLIAFGGLAIFFTIVPPLPWWAAGIAGLCWAAIGLFAAFLLRRHL